MLELFDVQYLCLVLTIFQIADLSNLLNMTQSAISHQLRVLKATRLVKFRRDGKVIYYSLDDEHIKEIFDAGLNHISE